MQGNTERQSKLKQAACACMLAAMLFVLTGCGTSSVFDGSWVSDTSGFRMEYSILNREESADLTLTEDDCLQVSLLHTEGTVDVTVGMDGNGSIYLGNVQQNADFVLVIPETGKSAVRE